MAKLFEYLNDGAHPQARGVMAYLQQNSGIEASWNDEQKRYTADVEIDRWHNCREQGYVVYMRNNNYSRQLNIAFFEHRNSDSICAVKWEQVTFNNPHLDNAKFGDIYKTKYDTSFSVGYGEVDKMASWIFKQLSDFWVESHDTPKEKTV